MIIVGLGNPGNEYLFTRHNVGFMLLDRIAKKLGFKFKKQGKSKVATIDGNTFVKPQTYMNASGTALIPFDKNEQFIVIYDDIDIELGSLKIKPKGRSTHNGVKSVQAFLNDFIHVRIGIGKQQPLSEFVLQPFSKEELLVLDKVLDKAVEAIFKIPNDLEGVMNDYNRKYI